ncbi:NADH-quinone oxidoreductase subunit L [Balneolales bacterium ANBcel1]|nr:NADH-quinone oxidoreductase subunit L [Balneolales bacterium ANBcel1]
MDAYVHLVPWIVLIPLAGFLLNGIAGLASENYRTRESFIGTVSTLAVFIPFVLAAYLFIMMQGDSESASISLFTWIEAGDFSTDIGYRLDQLSLLMTLVVTGVGALIHFYSIGYMAGDEGYWKFFAFMNLFIFAMLNLVLADNMLLLFLGWEGVGLCSYLLIGFWYTDMAKSDAAKKAFLYNRVGDFAFLIAMFMIFQTIGSLRFEDILAGTALFSTDQVFLIGFLILIGATGKSAQIPLFVWLPDAMAGPTSVSALIHAATMVTSGIYVISRLSPLYMQSPELMLVVAVIGAFTAIVAATIALTRYDIKAVLAYSTVSQLGFMFLALGSGAYVAAMFHVVTHAFFKACLFLGSGSVIHAMHHVEHKLHEEGKEAHFDPQDMRFMGGLKEYLPSTYKTFLIATIAIAGIPPLAGFFSKDEILVMTFNAGMGEYGAVYIGLWAVALVTAFLTAFYMFRLTLGIFHGKFRLPEKVPQAAGADKLLHESPFTMTSVLWVLAGLSVVGGFIGIPNFVVATFTGTADVNLLSNWLDRVTLDADLILSKQVEWMLLFGSVVIALAGVFVAFMLYGEKEPESQDRRIATRLGALYQVWNDKYLLDEIYEGAIVRPTVRVSDRVLAVFDMKIIDGFVNFVGSVVQFAGSLLRYFQTGLVQSYAYGIVLGVILVVAMLLFR